MLSGRAALRAVLLCWPFRLMYGWPLLAVVRASLWSVDTQSDTPPSHSYKKVFSLFSKQSTNIRKEKQKMSKKGAPTEVVNPIIPLKQTPKLSDAEKLVYGHAHAWILPSYGDALSWVIVEVARNSLLVHPPVGHKRG